jgi:hypothetical protein
MKKRRMVGEGGSAVRLAFLNGYRFHSPVSQPPVKNVLGTQQGPIAEKCS